ncbi:rod shape-determining protein, partial [candidate division WOR-3 bacterium]|nr:rod shape-determining protein [candidate division WOR-3 bacterium]
RNFDKLLAKETNLEITVAENPLECVVKGSGIILDDIKNYEKIIMQLSR